MISKNTRRIICITLLILLAGWYVWMSVSYPRLDTDTTLTIYTQSEVLPTLKTGDLVLLSGDTQGEKLCRHFANSPFSHVAMVCVDTDLASGQYILECDLGQGRKSGVRVIGLVEKLRRYKGQRVVGYKRLVSSQSNTISSEELMRYVNKVMDVKQDNLMLTWLFGDTGISASMKRSTHMFCSEFVASLMMYLHIIEDRVPAYVYGPGDFDLSRLPFKNGWAYSTTSYFHRE